MTTACIENDDSFNREREKRQPRGIFVNLQNIRLKFGQNGKNSYICSNILVSEDQSIEKRKSKVILTLDQSQSTMKNLEDMSDEELAMSYIAGNNRAFDLLLSRNQSNLFSYILLLVGNQDIANDVFQETFVKVIRKLHEGKYSSSGKFGAWCIRIAHNVIIDWYRRKKTRKIVETPGGYDFSNFVGDTMVSDNIENDMVHHQVMHDIRSMIELLPPSQREVVFLRYYQKLTFKQISILTNVSINTSLGRMRYALVNLRKMIREHHLELQLK